MPCALNGIVVGMFIHLLVSVKNVVCRCMIPYLALHLSNYQSSITIVVIVTSQNYLYQLGNPIVSWVILLYSRVNYVSSNQQLLSWRSFMFEPLSRYHSRSRNRCVRITCLLGINPSYSYSFLACFCATRIPILNSLYCVGGMKSLFVNLSELNVTIIRSIVTKIYIHESLSYTGDNALS